ncbi:MAG: NAD-dependent epimerase/dehydratase family protein [Xanthomonadaceae bacterium]|nr:NAD-dependent epimerase/dehydratase family protein [Xanthomonadaceae bacterium]
MHSLHRRKILKLAAAGGTLAMLSPLTLLAQTAKAPRPLEILFLGGTGFIGPHMVQEALDRGHKITLFNRGNSPPPPGVEQLIGDRDNDLTALEGRRFDAVVDTSGYVPRHVDSAAALLAKGGTPHYLFISTVAVYDNFRQPGMDESGQLKTLADPSIETVDGETYGPLKVLCEQAVNAHYTGAATILRPTFIIGPGDHTDRFIYYIDRPRQGGRMPVPGPQSLAMAYVDVRDLAAFTIHSLEDNIFGIYNMVSAPSATTFGEVMRLSLEASGADVELAWIAPGQMRAADLEWSFPMCPNPLENPGFPSLSQAAALAKGFSNRPFSDTVRDTYDWWMAEPEARRLGKRDPLPLETQQKWLQALDAAAS